LRPLTNDRPKALVEVGGWTLLEITLLRLREFGVREVIVNVHHFADLVVEYLKQRGNFGMRIEISREEELLDTGGGLKKAGWFFLEDDAEREQPFLLHNVDVVSTIDLGRMVEFHRVQGALATLAVQARETSRYLVFDEEMRLCGRLGTGEAPAPTRSPQRQASLAQRKALAFSGVHVLSPRIFDEITERGAFSIISSYVRLAAGEKIVGFCADEYYWRDLGKPESVAQAEEELKSWTLH
jgi:NDP-sugar pyrophosphorylase family protein